MSTRLPREPIDGSSAEQAAARLGSGELLRHFQAVEQLEADDQKVVIQLIDALLTKKKLQQLAS